MAIEIKELRIKVTVNEGNENQNFDIKPNSLKWKELKNEIVRDCTRKVLEQIKEKSER
jgi:hypothetical protein